MLRTRILTLRRLSVLSFLIVTLKGNKMTRSILLAALLALALTACGKKEEAAPEAAAPAAEAAAPAAEAAAPAAEAAAPAAEAAAPAAEAAAPAAAPAEEKK
jgi:hypothetical protein